MIVSPATTSMKLKKKKKTKHMGPCHDQERLLWIGLGPGF